MDLLKYGGLCLGGAIGLGLCAFLFGQIGFGYLIDMASFQVILCPMMFFGWLSYKYGESLSKLFMVLGIPIGLIGVMIGVNGLSISFVMQETSVESVHASASANVVVLLSAIYGGLASLIGYFFYDDGKNSTIEKTTLRETLILAVGVAIFWLLPISQMTNFDEFFDLRSLLLLTIFCAISVYTGKKKNKGVCESLVNGAIYSCVVGLAIGLASWYHGGVNPSPGPLRFSCLTIMYSLMIYVLSYLFSYYTAETRDINFSIKNWHLVETSTFFIFLIFAPISISDYLYNEKENIEQRAIETELRQEIKNLSDRLAAIEKVSRAK